MKIWVFKVHINGRNCQAQQVFQIWKLHVQYFWSLTGTLNYWKSSRFHVMLRSFRKFTLIDVSKKCKRKDIFVIHRKGRVTVPKRTNFRKSSKRPLTPPSCSKNYIAIFIIMATKPSNVAGLNASMYGGQIVSNTCTWFPEKGTNFRGDGGGCGIGVCG